MACRQPGSREGRARTGRGCREAARSQGGRHADLARGQEHQSILCDPVSPSTRQSIRPGLTRRGLAPLQPGAAFEEDRRRRSSAAPGGGHGPALRARAGRHPHLSAPPRPGVSLTDAPAMHGLLVRPSLLLARLEGCRRRPPSHSSSPRPAAAFAPARLLTGGPSARASFARDAAPKSAVREPPAPRWRGL